MNKVLIVIFVLVSSVISLNAQFTPKTKGLSSFARFKNTETYFVVSEREEMRNAQIKAIQENWTINDAHIISEDSFLLISKDRDKSFAYIHKMKVEGTGKKIKTMALVNGGYDTKSTYVSNTLAYISIDNEGYESNELDLIYRLPNLIRQLENIVKMANENNYIERSEEKVRNKMIKGYCDSTDILKNKILLVDRRYLNQKIISEKEFVKVYKNEVVFVDKGTITKAIAEKDAMYAYLVSALNLYKINTVTDCETGNIIYADFKKEEKFSEDFDRNFSRDDIARLNAYAK